MYFVNTYVGPHNILENEIPFVDLNGKNHGGEADGWIRNQIIARNLAHRDAIFPINLWNMVDRVNQAFVERITRWKGGIRYGMFILKVKLSYAL